jgi:DNA-binding response OmpR family regulator
MRVLLVDDRLLAKEIAQALRHENFAVDIAVNGEDGQHLGETGKLRGGSRPWPSLSQVPLFYARGEERAQLPVLILTARDGWTDKVDGFKAGADDYLTKPVRIEELVMRLRALVRRSAGYAEPRITCGPLTFDAQTGVFELNGLPIRLTALEWRVLACLTLRHDVVVERSELNEKAYEGDVDVDSNSLEVIVARLRRKIGHKMIETVRGRGYRLTSGHP